MSVALLSTELPSTPKLFFRWFQDWSHILPSTIAEARQLETLINTLRAHVSSPDPNILQRIADIFDESSDPHTLAVAFVALQGFPVLGAIMELCRSRVTSAIWPPLLNTLTIVLDKSDKVCIVATDTPHWGTYIPHSVLNFAQRTRDASARVCAIRCVHAILLSPGLMPERILGYLPAVLTSMLHRTVASLPTSTHEATTWKLASHLSFSLLTLASQRPLQVVPLMKETPVMRAFHAVLDQPNNPRAQTVLRLCCNGTRRCIQRMEPALLLEEWDAVFPHQQVVYEHL